MFETNPTQPTLKRCLQSISNTNLQIFLSVV